MKEIKGMGFVESRRRGDTGIGKTLEDLLGITENNIAGPDFGTFELKSGRKNSVSMLTLFTKSPQPYGINKELLRVFGYESRKRAFDDKELHVTVDSIRPNSVGLKLIVKSNRLYIGNNRGVEAYYDENRLRDAFERKYHRLIYVSAEHRRRGGIESFWFNEAYLLDGFSFRNFSKLIREGKIKVDIRIGHYPDGRVHDHGTAFRVLPRYLPECFDRIERII